MIMFPPPARFSDLWHVQNADLGFGKDFVRAFRVHLVACDVLR